VERKEDRRICVRKSFKKSKGSKSRHWHRELGLIRTIKHPNVCAFIEASMMPAKGAIYWSIDKGSLGDFLRYMMKLGT